MGLEEGWIGHRKEVYPSLTVAHLKRVLSERCLPDNIKEKIQFKRSMNEVWKFLDITFLKPDTFFHELMQPIAKARPVPDKDWKALEENLELLLHTFKHARESGMMPIVLHVHTLQMMYQK
jgi:hypothetical protein